MSARVLLVDDEPDMRLLLRMTLERSGFEVTEASDGESALEGIEAAPPDLVLLDLNLPGMSGFGVVEVLRRAGMTEAMPVVMLTADPTPDLPERAVEAGCYGFVSKIDAPRHLNALVRDALSTVKDTAAP